MKTTRHAVLLLTLMLAVAAAYGEETPADAQKLADQVKGAKVSLERGLQASTKQGTPISGKFESEDGKLQLSVYTSKGGKYYEVVVDHTSGKIAKVEEITSGDDLTAAKAQSAAMAHAKKSLRQAVRDAQKTHKGFRAVSVVPEEKDSHPLATVTLMKGHEMRTATEKLD